MIKRYFLQSFGAIAIAAFTILLYSPFLDNALVFDDHVLFTSLKVYEYARIPFDFYPRTFPYFTLGLFQVLFDSIEANRIISLILHISCAWILFAILRTLLIQASKTQRGNSINEGGFSNQANLFSFLGATWFALNPAAVYGAGYLAQRTILFATLFALLSIWYYCRSLKENRISDVLIASLFYSAAVFSKEHAVMLPLAAITFTSLYFGNFRLKINRAGLYLLLCLPAAITAVLAAKYAIGTTYEPLVGTLSAQLHTVPLFDKPWGPWFMSAVTQAGLFFDYFGYWAIPDTHSMSIDMRIDFSQLWTSWYFIAKAVLFLASPIASICLLRFGGLPALFGCGLLYSWLLYLTELTTVRFQEPLVLYRSYLWAPGFILMIVTVCHAVRLRWIMIVAIPLFIVCFGLARERLESLVSENTVWKDAGEKLYSETVLFSERIYFNRGLQYKKERNFSKAIADFSRAIHQNPVAYRYYYERGITYFLLKEFGKAQTDIDHAFALNSKDGPIHYARGMMFEQRGCIADAQSAYAASEKLGTVIAKLKLDQLAKQGKAKEGIEFSYELNACAS